MKNRTSEIIKKMEHQIPFATQQYSDLYAAYLHSFDDMFDTCYVSQKEFFDKLNIPQEALKKFDEYLGVAGKSYQDWLDLGAKYWQIYVQMQMSTIKSYDQLVHASMESYAQMLGKFNAMCNSNQRNHQS